MKLSCGCTPDASGFGYCSECVRKLREKIWKNMDNDKKNYDRHFDPNGSKKLDDVMENYFEGEPTGCSCHINPPCSYCTDYRGRKEDE